MASLFRRRISLRIAETVCQDKVQINTNKIASQVYFALENAPKPQFTFSWKRANAMRLVSEPEINQDILHTLNGRGLILSDGIIRVENSQDKHDNLIFTIDREYFIKEALLESYRNVKLHGHQSPMFYDVPKRKILVEYSSPNIAKPFHVGHIRSTIIGQVLSNLLCYLGNDVKRINYLGDWGTQYGILSAGYDKYASEEEMEKNPMQHLFTIYTAANQNAEFNIEFLQHAKDIFSKMEAGDESHLKRWRHLKEISLKEFSKIYSRLGIHFDETHSESMYHNDATTLIKELLEKKIATCDSEGVIKVNVDWPKQESRPVTIARSDGSTLYITRDIAAAIDRKKTYNFDRALYVVDKSQSDHFIGLKAILKKMGQMWADEILHIPFGRIMGMSTRKGNVVFLDELLDQARSLALKAMEESQNTNPNVDPEKTAEVLGISAVLINDLRLKRQNDYNFDWDRALHHTGDSGMELQYCHARLCSLEKVFGKLFNLEFDPKNLSEKEALQLTIHIARFDEALHRTFLELEPYILVMYLFRLNFYISRAYRELSLSRNERRIAESRYFLFHTARIVLQEGMEILGLTPLREM